MVQNGIVTKRYLGFIKPSDVDEHLDLRYAGLALPGFIDMHTHLRGLELSYKEDEKSGTRAAAKGGFTIVVDMPNTKPRINNPEALNRKLRALEANSIVDYGLYIAPIEDPELMKIMLLKNGVVGIKLYPEDYHLITHIIEVLKNVKDRILIVHAEHPKYIHECNAGKRWRCRPIEAEIAALYYIADHVGNTDIRVHITHITNALSLAIARKYGFSVDTCPHYLYLDSLHEYTQQCIAKVNPPLRAPGVNRVLLSKIHQLDAVSTDHAPHSIKEKMTTFEKCPAGISSIEIAASLMLNLVSKNFLSLDTAIRLLSRGPAKLLGLKNWGCFNPGCIASYTLVDLDKEFEVKSSMFVSKARITPYEGMKLRGLIRATIVRGNVVYFEDEFIEGSKPKPITELRLRSC